MLCGCSTDDADEAAAGQAGAERFPPDDGELTVKVVECIDLVPADRGGSSDPFVRLTLGDQINTTETVQKNLDPTFNADFHFEVSKAASRDDLKLLVEVFDKDFGSADDFLGEVELALPTEFGSGWQDNEELQNGKLWQLKDPKSRAGAQQMERKRKQIGQRTSDDKRQLKDKLATLDRKSSTWDKDNLYGAIKLELSYSPGAGSSRRPATAGTLRVQEIKCEHLVPRHTKDLSNPIVKFWIEANPSQSCTTDKEKQTVSPSWYGDRSGKPWSFRVNPNMSQSDLVLLAEVYHAGSAKNRLLGQCKIDLTREFEDGWKHNVRINPSATLGDPNGNVDDKDVERAKQFYVERTRTDLASVPADELYGTISFELSFMEESSTTSVMAMSGPRTSNNPVAKSGYIRVKAEGARGSFMKAQQRRSGGGDRKVYFDILPERDGKAVNGMKPKRTKHHKCKLSDTVLEIGNDRAQQLEIDSRERPDTVTIRCMQETEVGVPDEVLGTCVVDIRHKSTEKWEIAPKQPARHRSKQAFGATEATESAKWCLVSEWCTVLSDDGQPFEDDRRRIEDQQNAKDREQREQSPRRAGRRTPAPGQSAEPLNAIKVSMRWVPPQELSHQNLQKDVSGVWHAKTKIMPMDEFDHISINRESDWVGFWKDGVPAFYNEETGDSVPWDEEPDDGVREWRVENVAATKKAARGRGKRKKAEDQPDEIEEYIFLHQEVRRDGSVVITGHGVSSDIDNDDPDAVEWHAIDDEEQTFTVENCKVEDGRIEFDIVREDDGFFGPKRTVQHWEATLNFAASKMYGGRISGSECGEFTASRPTGMCEATRTVPMSFLCPDTEPTRDVTEAASRAEMAKASSFEIQRDITVEQMMEERDWIVPVVKDTPKRAKHLDDALLKLVKANDGEEGCIGDREMNRLLKPMKTSRGEIYKAKRTPDHVLLEASEVGVSRSFSIKKTDARGWLGALDIVGKQAVDWEFNLRPPTLRSLRVTVLSLTQDEDDEELLEGQVECVAAKTKSGAARTRPVELDDGVAEWEQRDRPTLDFIPRDASFCEVEILHGRRNDSLAVVRIPIPSQDEQGEPQEFDVEVVGKDFRGILAGEIECSYRDNQCSDSLDLSLWFCQSGQHLAQEVVPRHRCMERAGTFTADAAGRLLYLVEDELWNPPRLGSSRSAPPCRGTLSVCVLEARNLIAADENAASDPYVKLRLGPANREGTQEEKTRVVKKQLNPTWQQQLNFSMTPSSPLVLHVEVWDQDLADDDDFLGEVEIDLSDVMSSGANGKKGMAWLLPPGGRGEFYPLEDPEDRVPKEDGRMTRVGTEPFGAISLSFGYFLDKAQKPEPPALEGELEITLEDCVDLIPVSEDGSSQTSPYLIFKVGGDKVRTKVGSAVDHGTRHEWPSRDQAHRIPVKPGQHEKLEVEVWNSETMRDKFLGGCTVDLPALFYHDWETEEPPMLLHQLSEELSGNRAHLDYVRNKLALMRNADRLNQNEDNPNNEYGAVRLSVQYRAVGRRQTNHRSGTASPRSRTGGGKVRVESACVTLQQGGGRDRTFYLAIGVGESRKAQKTSKVQSSRDEGRSKKARWSVEQLDGAAEHDARGEQCIQVDVIEQSGRNGKIVDTGTIDFSDLTGEEMPLVMDKDEVILLLQAEYITDGIAGVWSADCEGDDDDSTQLMVLREEPDGTVTGTSVWDGPDHEPFQVVDGKHDGARGELSFVQEYGDGDERVDWEADVRPSGLEGTYGRGEFTAKQMPNPLDKTFQLQITTGTMDIDAQNSISKDRIRKEQKEGVGISARLGYHCEQMGVRPPRQKRQGASFLTHLPPTPADVDLGLAAYNDALVDLETEEPADLGGGWGGHGGRDIDEEFNYSFEELKDHFERDLSKADKVPHFQAYCNRRGMAENLPPPPWLVTSAERKGMEDMSYGEEAALERAVRNVAFTTFSAVKKFVGHTAAAAIELVGRGDGGAAADDDDDGGGDDSDSDSDADEPRRRTPTRRTPSPRRGSSGSSSQADFAVGDAVEVFSKSASEWFEGEVTKVDRDVVQLLYTNNKGQEMTKQLPIDSEDVRKFPRSARKLTLSPKKKKKKSSPRGGRRKSGEKSVKVKNTSDETLTLFWADDEEKTVKAGKTVEIRMASGDEIYAAAGAGDDAETVWGPETFRKQKSFTIDGDLSNWNSPASSRGSRSRSRSGSRSGAKARTAKLPKGWSEEQDEHGDTYYYNHSTGESSWDPPRTKRSSR